MRTIEAILQSDALAQQLQLEPHIPAKAWRALQGARELEREVIHLRSALAATCDTNGRDPAWKDEIARLLSMVLLFRVALADDIDGGALAPRPNKGDEQLGGAPSSAI